MTYLYFYAKLNQNHSLASIYMLYIGKTGIISKKVNGFLYINIQEIMWVAFIELILHNIE